MKTVVLYNKANEFGLRQDALLIQASISCELKDPLEPAVPCDFVIHLEVPYYGWMAFARVNAFVVNPEWWEEAWNPYLKRADYLLFKCLTDMDRFLAAYAAKESHPYQGSAMVVPWACLAATPAPKAGKEWLWLLGGSVHKREAALKILPLWKAEWPPLLVYTTSPLALDTPLAANITLRIEDLTPNKRQTLQAAAPCHLIFSASEALCMSAMEGEACGAFLLGNSLPTYTESFGGEGAHYTHLTPSTLEPYKAGVKDTFASIKDNLEESVWSASSALAKFRKAAIEKSTYRRNAFKAAVLRIIGSISTSSWQPMRFLSDEELPKISIVTLTYNRKKFLDLAFHNLLSTDYPKDKIEWVVVDDSDDPDQQASDKIIKFGRENAPMSMAYIPLAKRTIGRKRNVGIFRAENPIILFMDDDDHYPPSSFRRRVSALLTHPWKPEAVVCTTIACYDLQHGISAVNTPPWSLGLSKRVSEATLTFYKSFWEAKNFPKVNMAEGDEFIEGRTESVLEIPPQQIIVAMSHGSNSSRRFPTGGSPSCFWGFPKEFLVFLHGLVGVEVEA